MVQTQLPQVLHTYQNFALDSSRWQHFQPRAGDIVISTAYKAGTTWMQEIVRQLIFWDQSGPERTDVDLSELSPWFDSRWWPLAQVLARLEAQQHRRFVKSHLALDGLPFFPEVKYIVVGRDARDVAMSLWNHYTGFKPTAIEHINQLPGRVGEPIPPPPDLSTYWRTWFTRGWFPWESEGYPFWGNMHHTQTWWPYRHLPNILLVHYHDLKSDLAGEIRRVARFLEIPVAEAALPTIMQAVKLETMRNNAERLNARMKEMWQGGAQTFFYQGTNGRWQNLLTADELRLYDETAARLLPPACRAWLEHGRVALEAA